MLFNWVSVFIHVCVWGAVCGTCVCGNGRLPHLTPTAIFNALHPGYSSSLGSLSVSEGLLTATYHCRRDICCVHQINCLLTSDIGTYRDKAFTYNVTFQLKSVGSTPTPDYVWHDLDRYRFGRCYLPSSLGTEAVRLVASASCCKVIE